MEPKIAAIAMNPPPKKNKTNQRIDWWLPKVRGGQKAQIFSYTMIKLRDGNVQHANSS